MSCRAGKVLKINKKFSRFILIHFRLLNKTRFSISGELMVVNELKIVNVFPLFFLSFSYVTLTYIHVETRSDIDLFIICIVKLYKFIHKNNNKINIPI